MNLIFFLKKYKHKDIKINPIGEKIKGKILLSRYVFKK